MVNLAISHGDLISSDRCEHCGSPAVNYKLEAHHSDYSKPLEVVWLCRSCHTSIHETPEYNANRHPFGKRKKISEIAQQVHENGDANLSANEMMAKYSISLGSTAKIRAMLKNRPGDELIQ
jgi:hypothetical protein